MHIKERTPLTQSEYEHLCAGLPVLMSPPEDILPMAANLVAVKDRLDELGHSYGGSHILTALGLEKGYYQTVGTWTFVRTLLPFFDAHRSAASSENLKLGPSYKTLVPTHMVIGESWNWQPKNKTIEEQDEIIRTAFRALEESEPTRARGACADYVYIKALGFVFAHEGKNRVALFKKRNLPYIPAVVSEEDYPSADRIRIYDLPDVCIAVLDNRYVERVKSLPMVQDLLQAYGIVIESKWPASFPALERVLDHIKENEKRERINARKVDFRDIELDEKAENTEVDACLMDIESVILPSTKLMLKAFGVLLVLLAAVGVTSRWPDLRMVLAYAAGACNLLLVVPALSIVKCKVKHLKSSEGDRHFYSIRQRLSRGR